MATKLHNDYKFSYDNLKVLQGGWNEWKNRSAQDPTGYPIATTPGTTPGQSQIQIGGTAVPIDFGPPTVVTNTQPNQ